MKNNIQKAEENKMARKAGKLLKLFCRKKDDKLEESKLKQQQSLEKLLKEEKKEIGLYWKDDNIAPTKLLIFNWICLRI